MKPRDTKGDMIVFDIRLKEFRKTRGIKQKQVYAAIHIYKRNYQSFEYGESKPSYDVLIALADYFEVPLDYLAGRIDDSEIYRGVNFCDNVQNNFGGNEQDLGINEHLMDITEAVREKKRVDKATMEKKILELCAAKPLTINELSDLLDRTKDNTRNYVRDLVEKDKLGLLYPESETHPKQGYRTK